jgi:hypothetical protein
MPHIFISYSKKNKEYAQLLKLELVRQGFSVWIDDVIEPSEDWWRNIRQAIKDASAFTLIMTSESETSHYVGLELLHALEYKKPILPLLRSGDVNLFNSDTWSRIANIQYTDVREGQLPPDAFYTKLKRLQKPVEQAAQANDRWTPQVEVTGTPHPISAQTQAELTDFMHRAAQVKQEIEAPQPAQPLIWGVENILPPPFEWVYIPPGNVTINNQILSVDVFNIAKYPITNAQFEVFVQAEDGYQNPKWWNFSDDSQSWHMRNKAPQLRAFPENDHPRANINYFEALVFCKWLEHRFNTPAPNLPKSTITLPTHYQWQRAAQGNVSRKYPWGHIFEGAYCNTEESNIQRTTSVTHYPAGASSYGVMDMVGNVWEWCLDATTGTDPNKKTARGGAWNSFRESVHILSELTKPTYTQDKSMGFRIVMMNS